LIPAYFTSLFYFSIEVYTQAKGAGFEREKIDKRVKIGNFSLLGWERKMGFNGSK
jgi:hypothetical protein